MDSFECVICQKKLNSRYNLRVHINRTHSVKKFVCETCGFQFNRRDSLQRHTNLIHGIKFVCEVCGKQFNKQRRLQSHISRIHNENNFICAVCCKQFKTRNLIQNHIKYVHLVKKFECSLCNRKFPYKSKLFRHLRNKCASNKNFEKENECAACGKWFKTETKLQLHILRNHNDDGFVCAICDKQFKTRNLIQNHIKYVHLEKKFECCRCSKKFPCKSKLLRHLRRNCNKKPEKQNSHSLKCGFCNSYFLTKKNIQEHFQTDHDITLSWELLHFNSEKEFKEFKLNYQRKTITQFVIRDSHKKVNGTILYKCHRSGLYEHKKEGMRFPKMKGSKKMQSYCPSEMHVKYFEDGKYVVNFQTIHVGHNIGDENELCHIYVDPDERQEIGTKRQPGIPNNVTNEQVLVNQGIGGGNEIQFISNQDVQNVAASYNIQNESTLVFDDDLINVDTFVERHAASVLFLKQPFEEDTRFNVLANDDIALIFMSEFQEKNLRRYGKNIIAFDGTPSTNEYKFILHTLLIMDINYQGVPAAFLISNRSDDIIINIFLQCIKEKIGVFYPRVIMSDMQPIYENSWVKVMQNKPSFTLWCSWHVRTAWLKNYGKIPSKEKRNEVKRTTMDFAYELDPTLFQMKLNEFLSSKDADLTEFICYFRKQFVENERTLKWAYCYRKGIGFNTNMSLESFHKILKYIYEKGRNMDWLTFTLHCIEKYLSVKEISEEIAFYIGVKTRKLSMLRKNHHVARKTKDVMSKVHVINSNLWLVESFEKQNITYFVEKREIKECSQYEDVNCRLYCDFCQICFHEYSCNCFDAAIQNNMCKHIHAVGILQSTLLETHITDQLEEDNFVIKTITPQTTLPANLLNESSWNSKQVETTVQFQENETEDVNALEKDKKNMENWFHNILKKITSYEVLAEIENRFLKPIEPTIRALSLTPEIELKRDVNLD